MGTPISVWIIATSIYPHQNPNVRTSKDAVAEVQLDRLDLLDFDATSDLERSSVDEAPGERVREAHEREFQCQRRQRRGQPVHGIRVD